jgi:uncharacterized membrane protein YphA (DoxX/SURF4 family)
MFRAHEQFTFERLLRSAAPKPVVLIRVVVGVVFASEGIQKSLFAEAQGAGRFAKVGIPAPEWLGPIVGSLEVSCGMLLFLGLCTRLAAVPLLAVMLVAIASTKLPMLLGVGANTGLWAFPHESRTDFAMLAGCSFLVLVGADPWSLDRYLVARADAARDLP